MTHFDFLIAQQGTQFNRSQAQRRKLVRETLSYDPLFAGFNELGEEDDRRTVLDTVAAEGYSIVSSEVANTAVAVHPRVQNLTGGDTFVHAGRVNPRGYNQRRVTWARGLIDGNPDLDLTHHVFHSITGGRRDREKLRLQMAETASRMMAESSTGHRLATCAYDLNEDDGPGITGAQQKIFDANGLSTVWDDLKKYPDTFDGKGSQTIDGVARIRRDLRLSFVSAPVFDTKFSDHHRILVTVRVVLPEPTEPQPIKHPCPACGALHVGVV